MRCLPLQSSVREKIGHVLLSSRHKDLVFALLVANNQLVALLRPRKYSLHPADVHLIFNNITSSGATNFQSAELWMPLCLPRFNNTGFLHAHVSFVDEECTTCLLLITNEKNSFYELKQCRTKIVQALSSNGCLTDIAKASAMRGFHLNNIEIPDLRHFLYKSKSTSQFTAPVLDPPYNLPGEEQRLFRRYQYVHHRIHSTARPLKIYFHVGQKETILGWVTFGFELYACFSPLVTKPAAINAVLRLIRWMKREEVCLSTALPCAAVCLRRKIVPAPADLAGSESPPRAASDGATTAPLTSPFCRPVQDGLFIMSSLVF